MRDVMLIIPNAFSKDRLQPYIDSVSQHYNEFITNNPGYEDSWSGRTVDITDDGIVQEVTDILESSLKIKLKCSQAQIQLWPEGIPLGMHKHDDLGRPLQSLYNSMLYLNDDFYGGQFVTERGVEIEPRIGTISFFNGRDVKHGVSHFYGGNRYTIIFWWSHASQWI
jgi:hypothetical protein